MSANHRLGVGVAVAGIVLQVAGLGLITFLSQSESGISLLNPGHVSILVGIALVVAGAVWLLLDRIELRHDASRYSGLAVFPVVAMVIVLTGTSAYAIRSGDITATHSHGAGEDDHSHAGAGGEHHEDSEEVAESPTGITLTNVLNEQGTEAALVKLEELAATDTIILQQAHNYVHMIGRLSFERYGSAKEAFPHCRQTFESGCYHGVLEAHLKESGDLGPQDIATLCDETTGSEGSTNLRFQCVHGLGHGLSLYFNQDLMRALGSCDYLPTDWDRQSCYGGAFMQNIVAARELLLAGGGTSPAEMRPYLHVEDPHYPCNAVDGKYKSACYFMQTSAFLLINQHNFAEAFRQCDRAPGDLVWVCYNSLGRDVSATALWEPKKSAELCQLGTTPAQIPQCFAGVAANMIGVDWKTDRALEFCGLVPEGGKTACYTSIGHQIATLFADDEARQRECARGEARFTEACLSAARSYSTS